MPEQLLNSLQVCLLVLLYLFFLRVLRAVWSELRIAGDDVVSAVPMGGRRERNAAAIAVANPTHLVVRAPENLAGSTLPLRGVVTLGRSPTATLAVEDEYLSQHHARILGDAEGWKLEDLGSTNGTFLNDQLLGGPELLEIGDQLQLGGLIVEVR